MVDDYTRKVLAEIGTLPSFAGITDMRIDSRTVLGETPLHIAAVRGDVRAMAALLSAGAEVDARGEHGYTPLHEAVEQGHSRAVALLLERGASAGITNDDGQTPLALAETRERPDITRLFHGSRSV